MQENIQATIQTSIRELADTVLRQQEQRQQLHESEDETGEEEDNPFAHERVQREERGVYHQQEREDRRWEAGFKLDLPEFHGCKIKYSFTKMLKTSHVY